MTALGAVSLVLLALLAGVERAQERLRDEGGVRLESVLPVSAESAPSEAGGWDLANLDHEQVDYWIRRFQTDKRDDYRAWLARMGRYASLISAELAEKGMPQDLVYLAMIESGFNPKAYSHAHAAGIWQFIKETGMRYGLDVNRAVDERNDPVKSTEAALRYLTYLHKRFDSWYLAAAAYNTGENRVGRIMREVTGSERGTDLDYYRIWPRLPRDTRDYVPAMIAAGRIAKDPAAYGFDDVESLAPWSFREVVARPATPLRTLARTVGTTVDELKSLNPHLKLDRTRNDEDMVVRVPDILAAD
ncbi:MAG TPA: lytic transglycosylase domain-containing protein [Vicinamibacteria bacterium]|nr:lytic transglycosylase domain-containing protein [Vicinamibacteria bacterium]